MFEYGKEVKRFEAGLSFNLDKDKVRTDLADAILALRPQHDQYKTPPISAETTAADEGVRLRPCLSETVGD